MDDMPFEMLSHMYDNLSTNDLLAVRATSKTNKGVTDDIIRRRYKSYPIRGALPDTDSQILTLLILNKLDKDEDIDYFISLLSNPDRPISRTLSVFDGMTTEGQIEMLYFIRKYPYDNSVIFTSFSLISPQERHDILKDFYELYANRSGPVNFDEIGRIMLWIEHLSLITDSFISAELGPGQKQEKGPYGVDKRKLRFYADAARALRQYALHKGWVSLTRSYISEFQTSAQRPAENDKNITRFILSKIEIDVADQLVNLLCRYRIDKDTKILSAWLRQ